MLFIRQFSVIVSITLVIATVIWIVIWSNSKVCNSVLSVKTYII